MFVHSKGHRQWFAGRAQKSQLLFFLDVDIFPSHLDAAAGVNL
jgi:hypothetical protein